MLFRSLSAYRNPANSREGRERRWPLYVAAWGSFHVALARSGMQKFWGMYRYSLPLLVAMVLAFLELRARTRKAPRPLASALFAGLLLAACAASLALQVQLASLFVGGQPAE